MRHDDTAIRFPQLPTEDVTQIAVRQGGGLRESFARNRVVRRA
jgi:hypothetical protein